MHTLWILLGFNVGLFSVIVLVMLLLSWGELLIHWLVIQTMSVEFRPFSLSFFLLLNAAIWFAYGASQCAGFRVRRGVDGVYMVYRSKKPPSAVAMSVPLC
ncbi:Os02g0530001 [Oryza sativa Japonica Group]|uniref:Uncharacterized protein n=2 Tax=Oryza sativa subsp. japonica TaxID=39947 RepID=A0A0N7KFE9_ORYSJ|nr:hypothetical protein [Oryza sativa Japonica Group]BAS79025.1 Os02g0530001 [Oryza sativa Japonica Group]